ncbi:substrate-binding domain-containing protein [Mesorhizobium neociceri]
MQAGDPRTAVAGIVVPIDPDQGYLLSGVVSSASLPRGESMPPSMNRTAERLGDRSGSRPARRAARATSGPRRGCARRRPDSCEQTPNATFGGNDQIARGACDSLCEIGSLIHADVALASFENIVALAARPQLTTVDLNLKGLGREAADRVLKIIAGRQQSGVRRWPCSLVLAGIVAAMNSLVHFVAGTDASE